MPDLSDEELDKLVYGPGGTKKYTPPDPSFGELGAFPRGVGIGLAGPAQVANQISRGVSGGNLFPEDWVPDPQGKYQKQVESHPLGVGGEMVGSTMAGAAMALPAITGAEYAAPSLLARPIAGPVARAVIHGLAGLASRPVQNWQENWPEVAMQGGIPAVLGGWRGRQLQQLAAAGNKLRAAEAQAVKLTGQARSDAVTKDFAYRAAMAKPSPATIRDAEDAARQHGLSKAEVAQAIENLKMLRKQSGTAGTWEWIKNAPHGTQGFLWRMLAHPIGAATGTSPTGLGYGAGKAIEHERESRN